MPEGLHIMVIRLLIAAVLGGLIGFEREAHGRPAGLRTHILVSIGSALFTIVSANFDITRTDPTRIAAQVVSGIGFLGAGTIIRQGSVIRGLTTAASLWTVAAIGMAVGAGGNLIYLAVVASLIVFATLTLINRLEHAMISRRETRDLILTLGDRAAVGSVLTAIERYRIVVQGVRSEELGPGIVEVRLRLSVPQGFDSRSINAALAALANIRSFDWE